MKRKLELLKIGMRYSRKNYETEECPMNNSVETRLALLRKKLASRKGKMPYRDNVPLIEAEIARLEKSHG